MTVNSFFSPGKLARLLLLVYAVLLLVAPANGQTSAGRINGVILDPSGAVIAGARVTARNTETGIEHTVESNSEGGYILYPLAAGLYTLSAQAAGFAAVRIDSLLVDVAGVLTRDIRLAVGSSGQEVIVVSADATPLLTESGSVESTITREQISALPLNGRDFNQLVLLSAGTVPNAGLYTSIGRDIGTVASNGNRAFANDYQLDGTPNNDLYFAQSGVPLSVDVIREFKVISGAAPAEYGQAGTQVTMLSRSGSNHFHGSAFEYHRDTTFQAGSPFAPGAPLPSFNRNQFGGSIGGPIRRNHTFFFFNYEGTRQSQAQTIVSTVPPDSMWDGDFSSLLARNIQVHDPLAPGRPVFPGNIIPRPRIDSAAPKIRPYYGSPNRPGFVNNLVTNTDSVAPANQFTIRIDHRLPRNQNVAFRYTQSNNNSFTPGILGDGSGLFAPRLNYNGTLNWTVPLSSNTTNELRVGYADYRQAVVYDNAGLPTADSAGIQGFATPNPVRQQIPKIIFTGNDAFTQLNFGGSPSFGSASQSQRSRTLTLSEAFTHTRGLHTIKVGVEYRHVTLPALLQPSSSGLISFVSTVPTSSGYTFADFLLGLPASSTEVPAITPFRLHEQTIASYIQDDWRATRNLTLSFGVRHELILNPYEENNRLAFFDRDTGAIVVASNNSSLPTDQFLPSAVAKLSDGKGNWRFPLLSDQQAGRHARTLINPQYKHFGPRVGFSYRIGASGKFLVRGGYGVFYTQYPMQYLEQTLAANPPFAGTFNYVQEISGGVPLLTLQQPYTAAGNASLAPSGLGRDFTLPNNQQWNLTVERELGWGTALSLGYVGNKGTHLYRSFNVNQPYIDPVTKATIRPFSAAYGTAAINWRQTDANSIYHAMQLEVRRRTQKGLLFQANWTWAKGLDDVGQAVNLNGLDLQNLGRDRADSDYVRRHLFKVNAIYDLPIGRSHALLRSAPRWLDAAVGGWKLSGIWTFSTGAYFTPTVATSALANNRPDVVLGIQANLPTDQRSRSHWFNPAAFAPPPATDPVTGLPRLGNTGRNILIGPRLNSADANVSKSFPVFGENRMLSFRLEFFNVFNHPNYGLPDPNISNVTTVGTINSINVPMRQAQFAARFDF